MHSLFATKTGKTKTKTKQKQPPPPKLHFTLILISTRKLSSPQGWGPWSVLLTDFSPVPRTLSGSRMEGVRVLFVERTSMYHVPVQGIRKQQ